MTVPHDLSHWSLHCYCPGARQTPHALVRRGANGRLLFLVADWIGPEDWGGQGLCPSEDQLRDLERFRLIERRADRIRRIFPVLGPDAIGPARARMDAAAQRLLDEIEGHLAAIRQMLHDRAMADAFHAVILGRVFDGLLWPALKGRTNLPDTTPKRMAPDWRGLFWAVWPPRSGAIGTNELARGAARLVMVWSDRTIAVLNQIREKPWGAELLAFVAGDGSAPPPDAVIAGLITVAGQPRFPLFGSDRDRDLTQATDRLAAEIAESVIDQPAILAALPGLTQAQSDVILVHELIWAVQAHLGSPRREQLRDLVFAVL